MDCRLSDAVVPTESGINNVKNIFFQSLRSILPECFLSTADHALHPIWYIHPSSWRVDICVGWQRKYGKDTWNILHWIVLDLNVFYQLSLSPYSYFHLLNVYLFIRQTLFPKQLKFKVYISQCYSLATEPMILALLAACSYSYAAGSVLSVYHLFITSFDEAFTLYPSMIHRPEGHSTNVPTVLKPVFENEAGTSHSGTDEVLAITYDWCGCIMFEDSTFRIQEAPPTSKSHRAVRAP